MFKTVLQFTFIAFIAAFLVACETETQTFSKDAPFAVMAQKYRDPWEAVQAKKRLENMGMAPYLECFDTENEGLWNGVFLGSYPTLEAMMKGKIDYEDQFGLRKIERINFHQLRENFVSLDYEKISDKSLNTDFSHLDQHAISLIEKIPFHKNQRLNTVKLVNQMDGNVSRAQQVSKMEFDFPRGISPTRLLKMTHSVLEAQFTNDFTEQTCMIQAFRLVPDHQVDTSTMKKFGEQILATREYEFEYADFFETDSLAGFAVQINPRQDRILNYILVCDLKGEFMYFLQSREKYYPLENLKTLCKSIGQQAHLGKNPYFNRTLRNLPQQTDSLVAIQYERIQVAANKSANRWTGNDRSTYFFYTTETGFWKTELTHVPSSRDAKVLYEKSVLNYRFRSKNDSTTVGDEKAVVLFLRRRKKTGRGTTTFPESLYFKRGNTLGIITNRRKAWLTQAELEQKAMRFNLN